MRTRCSRWFVGAALAAAFAAFLPAGCDSPEDEQLLRFLGFQAAGSSGTGSVSMIEGDVRDGAPLKVDASFQNQTLSLDSSGGGTAAITVYRVDVDYSMAGLDPPSFSYPVSLYVPPATPDSKDTGGETVVLSDIPIVPLSVIQWLIDHNAAGSDGVIEMTAKVDFLARTDAGEDLTVDGSLAISLTDSGPTDDGGTPPLPTVTIATTTGKDTATQNPKNNGQFTVTRTGSTTSTLTVTYDDSTSTASSPTQYESLKGSVTIPAGLAQATIDVVPAGAALGSPLEVTVILVPKSTYSVGDPSFASVTLKATP